MSELKPCPFCGGAVIMMYEADGTPAGVFCKKCGTYTRFLYITKVTGYTFGYTQEKIVEQWNRRVTE